MAKKMEFKAYDWLDLSTKKPKYGIQAKLDGGDTWMNCCEDNKPLLFDTEKERDAKIAEAKMKYNGKEK
jgi:hypothetical protein